MVPGDGGFDGVTLTKYRNRVVEKADGDTLIAALDQANSVGCTMDEPALARVPKGLEAEGRRAELLRHKGVVARTKDNGGRACCGAGGRGHGMGNGDDACADAADRLGACFAIGDDLWLQRPLV